MDHLNIILTMKLGVDAPEGAGWYIQVSDEAQWLVKPIAIPLDAVPELAAAFQTALAKADAELPQIPITQIAQSGSNMIRSALEHQLRYAEEQAARVGMLRRKLALVPPAKATPPASVVE